MKTAPSVQCPACNKTLPLKGIPKHVYHCSQWATVIGTSPKEFHWDRHYQRGLFAPGLVPGVDWVRCEVCAAAGREERFLRMMDHLKRVHGLTEVAYQERYPGASVRSPRVAERRVATVRARYGTDNVFQLAEVKDKSRATMKKLYGAENALQSPEIRARVATTNQARYGAENPFASDRVKEKIVETNRLKFGFDNPNQAPEVIKRRMETNRQRYGTDHYLLTEEFRAKFAASSQTRWGTDHPMKSEKGKKIWEEANLEKFGFRTALCDPEVQRRAYETNLANHGGKHSQQCPEVLAKARATWVEKYGTDNPSKVEAVKQRIKDVWVGKYGVPFPPQSLWTGREQAFPNGLEKKVGAMCPAPVAYAGDGSYWVRCKGADRARNPDFVVLTPDQLAAYRAGAELNTFRVSAVLEAFGDYWHGPAKTGKSREAHAEDVLAYYEACGLQCLILWENDVKRHPLQVADRIQRYLSGVVREWVTAPEAAPLGAGGVEGLLGL
jgi:hypothetical protein